MPDRDTYIVDCKVKITKPFGSSKEFVAAIESAINGISLEAEEKLVIENITFESAE